MARFDLVVFDWDGTLVDSASVIARCVQAAFADMALPVPGEAEARHIIGLGLVDALSYLMPSLPTSGHLALAEHYKRHFKARESEIAVFPGAVDLLEALSREGRLLAVATGKSRVGLERGFRNTGLGGWFHASRCADESRSKPDPSMLHELCGELGVAEERVLMIGDTTHDLEMARRAGATAVAVSHGAHPREQLLDHGPAACVGGIPELAAWLRANA